jgi:hypothetical protein
MPFALNLFHDQVAVGGSSSRQLPPAHRMIYVRHGRAAVNGKTMNADEAIYCDEPVTMQAAADWSQVWRWEIALPNGRAKLPARGCRVNRQSCALAFGRFMSTGSSSSDGDLRCGINRTSYALVVNVGMSATGTDDSAMSAQTSAIGGPKQKTCAHSE